MNSLISIIVLWEFYDILKAAGTSSDSKFGTCMIVGLLVFVLLNFFINVYE